jgi:hypothetical protein
MIDVPIVRPPKPEPQHPPDAGRPMFTADSARSPGARKVTPTMPTTPRRFDDDHPSNPIGPDGLLKDGHRFRVPLLMRDSANPPREQLRGSGTAADPYIINSGLGQLALDSYRPGFRYGDADRSASEMARQERMLQDSEAWRTDSNRSTCYPIEDPGQGLGAGSDPWPKRRRRRKSQIRDQMGREAGTISEEENDSEIARQEMISDACNAWRKPPVAAALDAVSGDRWPLSAGEGNPCTTNGEPGVLVKSEDGSCLVCKVKPLGSTRGGASKGDAAPPPRSMTTDEAAKINTEAWRAYVDQLQNAWRS